MSLAEALSKITQQDLDEVVAKITELESELDTQKELRRIIEIKLGVRKPHGAHLRGLKRKPKAASLPTAQDMGGHLDNEPENDPKYTATEQHRLNVRKFLKECNGPMSLAAIAKQTHVPMGSITNVMRHLWFQDTGKGYMLTHDGKAGVGL